MIFYSAWLIGLYLHYSRDKTRVGELFSIVRDLRMSWEFTGEGKTRVSWGGVKNFAWNLGNSTAIVQFNV